MAEKFRAVVAVSTNLPSPSPLPFYVDPYMLAAGFKDHPCALRRWRPDFGGGHAGRPCVVRAAGRPNVSAEQQTLPVAMVREKRACAGTVIREFVNYKLANHGRDYRLRLIIESAVSIRLQTPIELCGLRAQFSGPLLTAVFLIPYSAALLSHTKDVCVSMEHNAKREM